MRQKRHMYIAQEAFCVEISMPEVCGSVKRDLYIWQKRPIEISISKVCGSVKRIHCLSTFWIVCRKKNTGGFPLSPSWCAHTHLSQTHVLWSQHPETPGQTQVSTRTTILQAQVLLWLRSYRGLSRVLPKTMNIHGFGNHEYSWFRKPWIFMVAETMNIHGSQKQKIQLRKSK